MSLAVSALTGLRAQEARYMWDFGVSLGMSGYTGDANEEFAFRRPGIHADLFGRYNFNSRWSGRVQAGVNSISGNTSDMNNALPGGADYRFTATVADLAVRGDFNLFPVFYTYLTLLRNYLFSISYAPLTRPHTVMSIFELSFFS